MSAFAFYGRVSTGDAQDPSLSIPRQLAACQRVLAPLAGRSLPTTGTSKAAAKPSPSAATAPVSRFRATVGCGTCSVPPQPAGSSMR